MTLCRILDRISPLSDIRWPGFGRWPCRQPWIGIETRIDRPKKHFPDAAVRRLGVNDISVVRLVNAGRS